METISNDQARRLFKLHMKPFKLSEDQSVEIMDAITDSKKNSDWVKRHPEVKEMVDNYPMVHSMCAHVDDHNEDHLLVLTDGEEESNQ